jgi:hypothetical protein
LFNLRKIRDEAKVYLNFIETYIAGEITDTYTDAARDCENIVKKMLEIVYGYTVKNMNDIKKNYPAIDLFDEENNTAYQVTANITKKKINDTFDKWHKIPNNEKYYTAIGKNDCKLKFAMLKYCISESEREKLINRAHVDSNFSGKEDIIDFKMILDEAKEKNKLDELLLYLEKECFPRVRAAAKDKKWTEIPSFQVDASTRVEISAINITDENTCITCSYGTTLMIGSNICVDSDVIYCVEVGVTNKTDVPITGIELKEFSCGVITEEVDEKGFEAIPIVDENGLCQKITDIIYPGQAVPIRFMFNDNQDEVNTIHGIAPRHIYISFRALVSSVYSDIRSDQNHRIILALDGSNDSLFEGIYDFKDIQSSVTFF